MNFSLYDDANATQGAGGYLNTVDITRLVGLQVSFVINVALNIFFIVIFASDRDLDLNQMDKYLCNLIALQDIISSVVQNATFCVFIFGHYLQINTSACLILTSTYALFVQLSSWQLCTVVLNKFLFIKYPLRYFSMVTKRRMIGFLLIGGMLSLNSIILLPFEDFPFTNIRDCTISGIFRPARATNSLYFLWSGVVLSGLSIPIVAIVLLQFALVAVAIKQARFIRRVAVMVHNKSEQSVEESRAEQDRNRAKLRGFLNVIYLVNVAVLLLLVANLHPLMLLVRPEYTNFDAILVLTDISNFLWWSKLGVLVISDVKLRTAAKKRLRGMCY